MFNGWEDLPGECWEQIIGRLTDNQSRHLESLSLVCKRLFLISSRLRSAITVSDRTLLTSPNGDVSPLFRRFHNLKRIHIGAFKGDLDRLILGISRSDLSLEALDLTNQKKFPASAMRELGLRMRPAMKTLICAKLRSLRNSDLFDIAASFPGLEELDISYPFNGFISLSPHGEGYSAAMVTDVGIAELASKLEKLQSINLSGNNFISDESLIALSSNCARLKEISVQNCSFLTSRGINHALRQSSNLCSLSINGTLISSSPDTTESFRFHGNSLHSIVFSRMNISDNLLFVIGEANPDLQKLVLRNCQGFLFGGISKLLHSCHSLKHLNLEGTHFLTDEEISILSEHLKCLNSIDLSSCNRLTTSTFFKLLKDYPSLELIRMQNTSLGKCGSDLNFRGNSRIRTLKLAQNRYLNNETLNRIGTVCSDLKSLDVSHCWLITEEGIGAIGTHCSEITELRIQGCGQVNHLSTNLGFRKLEILAASDSGIGDSGLEMIAQRCRRIQVLDLKGCIRVTSRGLKELVRRDHIRNSLRELNLQNCNNVSIEEFSMVIFAIRSLRVLISPIDFLPTSKQMDLYLKHGCLVTLAR